MSFIGLQPIGGGSASSKNLNKFLEAFTLPESDSSAFREVLTRSASGTLSLEGPQWHELATTTTSSTGATLANLDGMNSAYNIYKVIGEYDQDYDGHSYIRVRRGGTTQTSSEYSYTNKANRYGTDTFSTVADNATTSWPLTAGYYADAEYPVWFDITIVVDNNRSATGKRAFYCGNTVTTTTSGTVYAINNFLSGLYSGTVSNSYQVTGVQIGRSGSGMMKNGKFALYGWKG